MAEAGAQAHEHRSTEDGPEHKRRRIRKGTQSCWECKRRKVKCTFAAPTDTVCDVCKRRGASCIRQEFSDQPPPPVSTSELRDRLGRVEAQVGLLVQKFDAGTAATDISGLLPRARQDAFAESHSSTNRYQYGNLRSTTLARTNIGRAEYTNRPIQRTVHDVVAESLPIPQPQPRTCPPNRVATPGENTQLGGKLDEISRKLLAAWPSKHDVELLLSVPVESIAIYHALVCKPYTDPQFEDIPSPQDILEMPRVGSHPVAIARQLLTLGIYMQGIRPCFAGDLRDMTMNYRYVMSSVVETAVSLVTSSDELMDTLEGVECIMIESMYQNHAGNLRRGYLALRRGMVIAQMMGLHRGANLRPPKVLDPQTRLRINPDHLWFRLVQSDRYFSLMLGLPQGSLESGFASPDALEGCTSLERMERIDCAASGRIIQRNYAEMHDLVVTKDIDNQLQKAAASMSPQWWLVPNLIASAENDIENLRDTTRLMGQIAHYSLLEQLHLPYLLHSSVDRKYRYSKMMAVSASRELLSRFVSLRSFQPNGCYCRGIDFVAFIASTALCLAHIEAHRQRQVRAGDGEDDAEFDFLTHQRLGDCGMMERTLESMEHMVRVDDDVIASKIASILRHLLAIEADAANGGSYIANSSEGGEEELGCIGKVSGSGNVLRIYIPYLGTVKIERDGMFKSVPGLPSTGEEPPSSSILVTSISDPAVSFGPFQPHERQREQERHVLATSEHPAGYHVGSQSANPDWQAVPSHFDELSHNIDGVSSSNTGGALDPQLLIPGLTLDADDWALQGVDIALFDNLIRGSEVLDETWAE